MNLTLSIDKEILKKARAVARSQGKSVNQVVREYLQQMASRSDIDSLLTEFRKTSRNGHSKGQQFNRDELYERA